MFNLRFEERKYDGILVFVCFFGGALAAYLLMHHSAIFGL
jgi:hypothetical protein